MRRCILGLILGVLVMKHLDYAFTLGQFAELSVMFGAHALVQVRIPFVEKDGGDGIVKIVAFDEVQRTRYGLPT